jgi:hypothetical protein
MNKHRRVEKQEEGQSLIIVGALLIVLVALIGLVVDVGNAYAQKRIVQNACDAAALAGSQMLVHQEDYLAGGPYLRNWQVIDTVEDFADRNGVHADDLAIYYTDVSGNILADAKFDLGRQDIIYENTFGGTRAEGVRVEGDRLFDTYLVRVIGRNEMTASAESQGILACGACSAGDPDLGGLFPIAVYTGLFDGSGGRPVIGEQYRVFEKDEHFPGTGSFGWLSWTADMSNPTLTANMADTTRSGRWSVGQSIPTATGVMQSSGVRDELTYRIDNRTDMTPSRPATVTLPIFDYTEGNGSNKTYHIVGFGQFRLECWHASRNQNYGPTCTFDSHDNEKWVAGTFVNWVEPVGEAGCTNYGICTAKLRPPLEVKRTLIGNVVPWRAFPAEDQLCEGGDMPVDLVHVLDISGSMCAHWNGSSDKNPPCTNGERIATAKDVVSGFNEGMDWNVDNQVGLATYPRIQNTSTYYTDCGIALGSQCRQGAQADCGKTNNLLYFATKNVDLTTNMAYVNQVVNGLTANGGTSMPIGLQYGREMVTDPAFHNPDNLKVLILTTDGMANIKIDGYWSGYSGNYTNPPLIVSSGCNLSVYQAAVQQANLAKQEGVVIFTIGIHTNIDEDLMTAIASPDTDPSKPHFFLADDMADFETIYDQIHDRLPTLCSEECVANENAAIGKNATVRLYDDGGNLVATTTADASGGFIFSDLEPGTYELRAQWTDPQYGLLYDVLTWVLGGEPLQSGEKIWVEIPQSTGTSNRDVYLRTSQQLNCD